MIFMVLKLHQKASTFNYCFVLILHTNRQTDRQTDLQSLQTIPCLTILQLLFSCLENKWFSLKQTLLLNYGDALAVLLFFSFKNIYVLVFQTLNCCCFGFLKSAKVESQGVCLAVLVVSKSNLFQKYTMGFYNLPTTCQVFFFFFWV